jgi:hypothetical protein
VRLTIFLFLAGLAGCGSEELPPVHGAEPKDVSMVQLLADPSALDGRVVRVVGFCHLEFEGNALYLHREDFEQSNLKNSVWLAFSPMLPPAKEALVAKLSDRYILVEATVDSREKGHFGMFSAELKDITSAEPVLPRAEIEKLLQPPPPPRRNKQ